MKNQKSVQLFSISARAMFCRQLGNDECHVRLILEYRRLHDKILRLVSGGAEEAGMKGGANTRLWKYGTIRMSSFGGGAELSNGEWMKRHGETNAK